MNDWQTQVRLLWWSQLIAVAAMEMSEPFWPLFLRQLQGVESDSLALWSALIYGAPLLVAGFAAPVWGRLGDRFGHKPMVLRSMLGLMLTQALLYFSSSLWEVLLYRLLQGALAGIITAALCFATAIAPQEKRASVVGRLTAATAAGAIIGPVVGGALVQWLDYRAIFLGGAAICLLLTLLLARRLQHDGGRNRAKPEITSGSATLSTTLQDGPPMLALLLLVILLLQSAKAMPSSFFALFAEQQLGSTPLLTGLLFSAAGFGMMLSASGWGQLFDRLAPATGLALLSTIALAAAACYLAHLYSGWLSLLAVRFAWGICLGAMLPMVQATLIRLSDNGCNGRLIGAAQSCIRFGNLAGVGGGALLMSQWSYSGGFHGATLAYLLAAAVLFLAWLRLTQVDASPATAGASHAQSRSGSW
ncbi:MFS transporter [Marinobacterium zhoushanense]|uniref:MFS transporter n=1 Tax=Marinobacterium zhoushanense TaxID=1679163 RepID=A0ABQ1KR96_9GAMM|nr:MFS transporter [Marinobacterium zhoushanense]GGC04587.1 MFS transporter [Marinobacterium zhoushanense]